MNNTLVQQSLIEIEQNLKSLVSARDQVGSVAEASQNLVRQISSIAKKLEKDFLDDRKDYHEKMGEELQRFQTNLDSSAKNAIKISSNLNENQGVEIKKSIEKVSQFLESLKSAREKFDSIDFDQKFAPLRTSFLEFEQQIISQNKIIEFQQGILKFFRRVKKSRKKNLIRKLIPMILTKDLHEFLIPFLDMKNN